MPTSSEAQRDVRIRARGLSKVYQLGQGTARYGSLRESLTRLPRLFRRTESPPAFWALRDVSFEVAEGEVVGIIGRNGAGKSTLLKLLSRITEPTEGEAMIHGRVGSLLEVGTGFHPELTGRENIYLNGAILGMRRREIDRKFDEIVAFAEVSRFLDTAVKHYSSGMYLRLAFAVAAHLDPEILLVDEVLAVGDAEFQKKCLARMGDVSRQGRTILFVSHNLTALRGLCSRVIWLDEGRIRMEGACGDVIGAYLKTSFQGNHEQIWDDPATAPGNDSVRVRAVRVRPTRGTADDMITVGTPFVMEFEFWNFLRDARLNLSVHLINQDGVTVFNTFPMPGEAWSGRPFPEGLFRSVCHVPANLLNEGTYQILLLVVRDQGVLVHRQEGALSFEIADELERNAQWYGKWIGATRPLLKWETTQLGEAEVAAPPSRISPTTEP